MPISRSRNTQHKVYIPAAARKTHYLLSKFSLTDKIVEKYAHLIDKSSELPYQKFYQHLADRFWSICAEHGIESGQFVANDKFPRIRYSPEKLTVQTDEQILFLYDPRIHYSQNTYINSKKVAEKIELVFLANGDDVRETSAFYHDAVRNVVTEFKEEIGIEEGGIRFCDHQHLTYDLFAKAKGITGTQTHKLRTIKNRYLVDGITLPEQRDVLTYAVIDIPFNHRIKNLLDIDKAAPNRYEPIYKLINDTFVESANNQGLKDGAVVAKGLVPIVRNRKEQNIDVTGELVKLGYNPFNTKGEFSFCCDAGCIVDAVKIVVVASVEQKTRNGYGKFLNHVELALRSTAEKLGFDPEKEEIMIRLHQHIGYDF